MNRVAAVRSEKGKLERGEWELMLDEALKKPFTFPLGASV